MNIVPQNTPLKQCTACKLWKPATLDFFSSHKGHTDVLNSMCKICNNERQKQRRINPLPPVPDGCKRCTRCKRIFPATTEYFTRSRPKQSHHSGLRNPCKECFNTANRKHAPDVVPDGYKRCTKCKEIKLATQENFHFDKEFKGSNLHSLCKVCRNAKNREDRLLNLDKYRERDRKNDVRPRRKQWRKAYLQTEKCKATLSVNRHKRRARKKQVTGAHTAQQIQDLYKRQKGRCYYCSVKFGKGKNAYHIDHTFPLSREVSSNDISYIVLACPTCNIKKGNKYPWEFFEGGRLL